MKICFVVRDPVPKYSLMALAAYLRREGHRCDIVFANDVRNVVAAVRQTGAGAVGFSCTSGRHLWAIETGRLLKRHLDVFTVIGGPHATFFPGIVKDEAFDAACVGEGEEAMVELLDRLEAGEPVKDVANLWVKEDGELYRNQVRPLIADLDSLPAPDRELYMHVPYIRQYQRDTFIEMTGRGCPYNCSFCYNRAAKKLYQGKGHFVRRKSVKKAIAELREAHAAYRLNGIIFEDDTFTIDPAWVLSFLDVYATEVKVPFVCNARGDHVTLELARSLARAGCRGVRLGVEAGNEEVRRKILKKSVSNDDFVRAAAYLKQVGIKIQCFNIIGIPGADLSKDFETLFFNMQLGIDHPWCSVMNPYPQTEIREIARAAGVLEESEQIEDFFRESYFVDTALEIPDKRKVLNLHHFFAVAVRHPALLPLIERLSELPLTPLYEQLFKLDHVSSLKSFYGIRTLHWIRFLWHCRGIY